MFVHPFVDCATVSPTYSRDTFNLLIRPGGLTLSIIDSELSGNSLFLPLNQCFTSRP